MEICASRTLRKGSMIHNCRYKLMTPCTAQVYIPPILLDRLKGGTDLHSRPTTAEEEPCSRYLSVAYLSVCLSVCPFVCAPVSLSLALKVEPPTFHQILNVDSSPLKTWCSLFFVITQDWGLRKLFTDTTKTDLSAKMPSVLRLLRPVYWCSIRRPE